MVNLLEVKRNFDVVNLGGVYYWICLLVVGDGFI